ncbi:MAG: hypothetical protein J5875_12685, partial [Paludibacteraceae bacterium]|nr:hypothetical protein [Paludibacteraceae bacterium]
LVDEHTTTYENPFKFSGKELDDITGLYDHGARNRNPITAVWYGIDELFENDPDKSPYHYCGGNPVRFVDLDGRVRCTNGMLDVQDWNNDVRELVQQRLGNPDLSGPARDIYQSMLDNNGISSFTTEDGRTVLLSCGMALTDKGTPVLVNTALSLNVDDMSNCNGWAMLGGQAGFLCGDEAKIVLKEEYAHLDGVASPGDLVVISHAAYKNEIGSDGKYKMDLLRGNPRKVIDHVAVKIPDLEDGDIIRFRHKAGWENPVRTHSGKMGVGTFNYDNVARKLHIYRDINNNNVSHRVPGISIETYRKLPKSVVPIQINP